MDFDRTDMVCEASTFSTFAKQSPRETSMTCEVV